MPSGSPTLTSEVAAGAQPPPLAPAPAGGSRGGLAGAVLVDVALLVGALVFFSVALVAVVLVPGFASLRAGASPTEVQGLIDGAMPAITVAAIAAMLLTALVVWGLRRKSLAVLPAPMPARSAYALAAVAGVAIQAGAQTVFVLLDRLDTQVQTSNAEPVLALLQVAPWLAALAVVVAAPLAEELLFRHVLLRRFALAGHALLGVVLTSVLFSLMHEPFPGDRPGLAWLAGLGLYAGMGIAFGLVYLRTRRLGAAFVAHAVCNLCALSLVAYSGY